MKEKKDNKKKIIIKSIIYFFIAMLIFTILSRISDSMTVAKVSVTKASSGALSFTITGTGTVNEISKKYIKVKEDIRIDSAYAEPGQEIKIGDPVYAYDLEDLNIKQKEAEKELKKLQLQLQQEEISSSKTELFSETKIAELNIQQAELDLQAAQDKLSEAEVYRDEDKINSAEENVKYMEFALAQAKLNLDIAKQNDKNNMADKEKTEDLTDFKIDNINSEITIKEYEISQIKASIDAIAGVDPTDSKLNDLANELKTAQNDLQELELLLEEEELNSTDATTTIPLKEAAELALEKAEYDLKSAKETLKKIEEEKDEQKIVSARENVTTAERALRQAQLNLEEAALNDKTKAENAEKELKITNLKIQSIQLDVNEINEKIDELKMLIENSGIITSPIEGTVIEVGINANQKTTGQEVICIGVGGYSFKATLPKEQGEYIGTGDEIAIKLTGSQNDITASINNTKIITKDNTVELTAKLDDNDYLIGSSGDFNIKKNLGSYDKCIPIEALREDSKSKFILVTRTKESILGEEMIAYRIDVSLIEKGNTAAAVEGAIMPTDKIIVDSNKYISDGDRVRVDYD